MVGGETLYVRIIDNIQIIIPRRETVVKRRQKGDERYSCNDTATEKCSEIFQGWVLPVVIHELQKEQLLRPIENSYQVYDKK